MRKINKDHAFFGSVLVILGLFLPLAWNLFPSALTWCFPWFDASTQSFSLNPVEPRCYELRDIVPYYFAYFLAPIYYSAKEMIPTMEVSFRNVRINVWRFHMVYVCLQAIDLFLSFSQAPYFRTGFIVVGLFLQVCFLFHKSD